MLKEPATNNDGGDAAAPVFRLRRKLEDGGEADRARLRQTVARAKAGDGRAVHDLYDRYADNVFSYVRAIIHDDHEAEDVTQHVFTKLMTRIDRYEERSVPFTAWLLRIARNCAIDHVRNMRVVPCEEVPAVEGPIYDEVAADRRRVLRDALGLLPAGQRRVVFLRHVVGLSPCEIAIRMGKSEGAIHTLHHRARRALRKELSQQGLAPAAMGHVAETGDRVAVGTA